MSDRAPAQRLLTPARRPTIAFVAHALVAAWLAACSADHPVAPPTPPTGRAPNATYLVPPRDFGAPPSLDDLTPLYFSTYDGSGQVAHPDIAFFPDGWRGRHYWAGITPYPNGNRAYENPSLFASDDGDAWSIPAGVHNPVMRTRRGHLSDPDIIYNARTSELWLYYREAVFKRGRHLGDNFFLTRSGDGVQWSAPSLIASHRGRYVVSPSVTIGPDGVWRMWAVDAGVVGCTAATSTVMRRQSSDGIHWSTARSVPLSQPGYLAWHLEVQYVATRGEYWALIAAYPRGRGCSGTDLFFATSRDGNDWTTYPAPVLAHGVAWQFGANVYRSSLVYDAERDAVTIWLTGARVSSTGEDNAPELRWSAAVVRTDRTALLARVNRPAPMAIHVAEHAYLREAALRNGLP